MDSGLDIYHLLVEEEKKRQEKAKSRVLQSIGVNIPIFFKDGDVKINKSTCEGVDCRLCIKACPTNALYWSHGEVKIIKDLCIQCAACVLCCIVDGCIQITRKRNDGKLEVFSTPKEAFDLMNAINSRKRKDVVYARLAKVHTDFGLP